MRQKFHMDKYYDELGNVEEKLNRIKSEKSTKQIKREDSRGNLTPVQVSTWTANRSPVVATRPYVAERQIRPLSKQNDSYSRQVKPRIRLDSRYDRDPSFVDTNQTVIKRPNELTTIEDNKLEESYNEQLRQQREGIGRKLPENEFGHYSAVDRVRKQSVITPASKPPGNRPSEQEEIFIRQTNSLYQINYLSCEEPINQLVQELRRRDSVYKVVQQRFPDEQPNNLHRHLENLFRRQAILTKVVDEFKKLSNIQLEDLEELLYFLKNQ